MSILIFFLVLSALVLVHEAGHYFSARALGVKAEEFGFGFPPRLVGFVKEGGKWKIVGRKDREQYTNTIWSLNWLPLGGFVKIKGEQAAIKDKDSFHVRPVWQRFIILAAGVTMNWILAFVLFTTVFIAGTQAVIEDLPSGANIKDRAITITQVLPNSPASKAGFLPGDSIVSIAGAVPQSSDLARSIIGEQGSVPFTVAILRNGESKDLVATLDFVKEVGRPALGVGIAEVGSVSYPPFIAVKVAAIATIGYTKAVVMTFIDIFRQLLSFKAPVEEVSGPVGIAVLSGQIARQGIIPLLQFAAILSINLAVINFLPIPAFDGGRVLFLFIEKLRRRAMNQQIEAAIHNVSFIILIALILLVTMRDVFKFGGVILDGAKGLVGM